MYYILFTRPNTINVTVFVSKSIIKVEQKRRYVIEAAERKKEIRSEIKPNIRQSHYPSNKDNVRMIQLKNPI